MRRRSLALGLVILGLVAIGVSLYPRPSSKSGEPELIAEWSTLVDTQPSGEVDSLTLDGNGKTILRLVIPRLGIDAPTVELSIDSKGVMQAPSGPAEVAWYDFSSKPGAGGNIVMSGHVDLASHGPAVFWRLREVQPGDVVQVMLEDQSVASYRVMRVSDYQASTAPVQEIVGPTPTETITLITCDGRFDSRTGQYERRLVVQAVRT